MFGSGFRVRVIGLQEMALNVTDRRNTVFVGLEVGFDWL